MDGTQLSFFDAFDPVAIRRPVDPDGPVIPQSEIDEVLFLPHPKMAWHRAEIELHQHIDGTWMWSASFNAGGRGHSYRVGPKWGRFAATRDDALRLAVKEIEDRLIGCGESAAVAVLNWASALT